MINSTTFNPKVFENRFFIERSSKRNYTCLRFIDSYVKDPIKDFSCPPSWHWYNIYYFEEKAYQIMYLQEDVIKQLLLKKKYYMKKSKITLELL